MQQLRVLPHFFQQQASFLIVYLNRQVVSKQEPGRVTIFDFENVSKRYYYSRYISMIINHKRDGRASTWTLSSQLPRMIRRQRRVSRDRSIDGTNMGGGGKGVSLIQSVRGREPRCLWRGLFTGSFRMETRIIRAVKRTRPREIFQSRIHPLRVTRLTGNRHENPLTVNYEG